MSDSNTVWLAYHGTHLASAHIVGVFDTEDAAEAALDSNGMKVRNYENIKKMTVGGGSRLPRVNNQRT